MECVDNFTDERHLPRLGPAVSLLWKRLQEMARCRVLRLATQLRFAGFYGSVHSR